MTSLSLSDVIIRRENQPETFRRFWRLSSRHSASRSGDCSKSKWWDLFWCVIAWIFNHFWFMVLCAKLKTYLGCAFDFVWSTQYSHCAGAVVYIAVCRDSWYFGCLFTSVSRVSEIERLSVSVCVHWPLAYCLPYFHFVSIKLNVIVLHFFVVALIRYFGGECAILGWVVGTGTTVAMRVFYYLSLLLCWCFIFNCQRAREWRRLKHNYCMFGSSSCSSLQSVCPCFVFLTFDSLPKNANFFRSRSFHFWILYICADRNASSYKCTSSTQKKRYCKCMSESIVFVV